MDPCLSGVAQPGSLAYSPLQDGQIRLLELAPATEENSPIACKLITVSPSESREYEALSYVWGETSHDGQPLLVGDIAARVTDNLVMGEDLSTPHLRDCLIQFFSSEWFFRVWTVQEFVLAKRTTFVYGTTIIDGQRLQDGFTNLRRHAANSCCGVQLLMEESPLHQTALVDVLHHMDTLNDMRRTPEASSLLGPLHHYRRRRCSDPRDRLYGMLGMRFAARASRLRPDYTITPEQLFVEIAKEQIERTRSLDILSYVMMPGQESSSRIPTYVPDWNVASDYITHVLSVDRLEALRYYQASAGTRADFRIQGDWRAVVNSILVDRIQTVGKPCFFSTVRDVPQAKDTIDEARAMLGLPKRLTESLQSAGPEEVTLWRALCGNLSVEFGDGELERGPKVADPEVDFESYLRWNRAFEASAERSLADLEVFENAMVPNISARRFMRTEAGRIGFVPASSQPDDIVVIFAGGKVPYVLRELADDKADRSRSLYTFIGDAYVDGVMNGEAVHDSSIWTPLELSSISSSRRDHGK
ncbi:hypothetical protein Daus18300_010477 [Diaporthe australafricana]|uniref:Heterokaryon incompatibility domain-containing protein n=1 Tax=Diaporthe australafricana TaxID=127596 RepID=A0ABR3WAS2_9PEZI